MGEDRRPRLSRQTGFQPVFKLWDFTPRLADIFTAKIAESRETKGFRRRDGSVRSRWDVGRHSGFSEGYFPFLGKAGGLKTRAPSDALRSIRCFTLYGFRVPY